MFWLKMWWIDENVTLQNIDDIKNIITFEFKEKLWCDENLEDKRKLRYYNEFINHNLEDQNYLFVLTSIKKKIHIAKIRMNSHELHREIGRRTFHKTSWAESIYHLCETMSIEDKKHFFLDCPIYTHTRSQFQKNSYNLSNLLSHQN